MDLRGYEQSKFAVAEILRSAGAIVADDETNRAEQLQSLFARLAEDRFTLVVVGRFSRGKTSLMNAILGTDRLPIGFTPLTSVITTVAYGSKELAVLKYDSRILTKEIPIDALPQHITQHGNPGNIQQIRTAEVQIPAEILRRGFYFVDTPGLGSAIVENTLTTEAFLSEADAFLLVTTFDSPLSEEEVRFFRAVSSSGRRIFVVLNKQDTVSAAERQTVLAFVREQLQGFFGRLTPQVFSVSSTEGLGAKRARDRARLAASGIPELEEQLVSFLLKEKLTEFLLQMCDRIKDFIERLPRTEESVRLSAQVDALAKQFGGTWKADATSIGALAGPTEAFSNSHRVASCEICAEIAEKQWSFLCRYQYELIAKHAEQDRFAERGGFCPFHTWQHNAIASPYGICAGYPMLFDRLAVELCDAATEASTRGTVLDKLRHLLPTHQDCVLCSVRDNAEAAAIEETAARLVQNKARTLNSLSAICLSHFAMLVGIIDDNDVVRELTRREAATFQRLSEDMRRYALKHNAVRRHLASQEETTAAERGLLSLVGRQNVNFSPIRIAQSSTHSVGRPANKKGGEHGSEPARECGTRDQQTKIAP
jgi:GTP-binding protein EngB required for normal cell division